MTDTPTPGQIAWRAYQHMDPLHFWDEWEKLHAIERRAWEAAAQAVLEAHASLCPICNAELERCNAKETP